MIYVHKDMELQVKKTITGLGIEKIEQDMVLLGEKSFRGRQVFQWIYEKKVRDFDQMTNLAVPLRQRLSQSFIIGCLELVNQVQSRNTNTIKYLLSLSDGLHIESVFIPEGKRKTLCVSSQVGCSLGCRFCQTARMGFKRNLTVGEIVDQVLFVEALLGIKMTNIVFMGMGEPFLNYEAVLSSAELINHQDGISIGHKHIVVSTAGIIPAIYRYTDEGHRYKLAVSLNSPDPEERQNLMPVSRKYPLYELKKALEYYTRKSRRRVTFEYVLLKDVNDRLQDARAIKKFVTHIPCKINLIPYNETSADFQRPAEKTVQQFVDLLKPLNAPVSVRWSRGDDARSACGQLAAQNE
ncbi:23S rRNA (adenine(2503)-C(2))-methyltransferase RlmN [candidate division KSB1 bacterium]|nr:23S rRNA (adenine(2503)-C(2))-methyltransferase RlmN [candidate division KSB1 bacterium]